VATRTRAIATIAAHELTASVRGRTVPAFAALFALLAVGIALEGLGASGQVLVQGFTRTAVSLLTLSVYLLPLFWLAAALLYDLAAIAVLQVTGNGEPGPWLVALLALNPVDGVRALGLVALGADTLLGPTGAALRRLMGDSGGAAWVVASTMVWLAGALAAAVTVVRRRDY